MSWQLLATHRSIADQVLMMKGGRMRFGSGRGRYADRSFNPHRKSLNDAIPGVLFGKNGAQNRR